MYIADKYYVFITTELIEDAVALVDGYGKFKITDLRQLNYAITKLKINESSIDKLLQKAGIIAEIAGVAVAAYTGGAIYVAVGSTATAVGVLSKMDFDGDYAQKAIDCQIDSLNLNLIYSYFDIKLDFYKPKEKWQYWENRYVNKYKYDLDEFTRYKKIDINPTVVEIAEKCGWI